MPKPEREDQTEVTILKDSARKSLDECELAADRAEHASQELKKTLRRKGSEPKLKAVVGEYRKRESERPAASS